MQRPGDPGGRVATTIERGARGARRRGRAGVLTGALALLLAAATACGGGPPPGVPPLSVSPTPGGGRGAVPVAPTPGASFSDCDGGFQCATIPVPVDYANPTGPTLPMAIVRQPARDQAHKKGVLLVNPGGPGGSGIDTVEQGVVPPEVADQFDVIGFDPRGVGRSVGLKCPLGPETPYLADPEPGLPSNEAATKDSVDRYDAGCGNQYRDLLPHLGTRNVASDMDRIRDALGQQQITYLGFSYGTAIGQVYAQMFPQRIRAMVLDGVVDISKPGLDPSQAVSFENSLRQFAADCSSNPSCPARPDPIAMVDRVGQRVATTPLPANNGTTLSAGMFEIGLSLPLYSKSAWPKLAKALAAADAGDGRGMRDLADEYFKGSNSDTYNAVTCLDNQWPRDPNQIVTSARQTAQQAPHFSGNVLISGLTCADWPTPQQVLTPLTGYSGPPLLVIGTTNDPATPYQNSVGLARSLPGSALLTYRGDGHTAYGSGRPCVDGQVDKYLNDLTLPANPTC